MQNTHSKFWIGNFDRRVDVLTGEVGNGKDHVKLASTLRAVSNFVNIVTGQNVPVRYRGSDSYTDGKSITISANVKDNNFDPTVGLALHEGSHVKLTDFSVLNKLQSILMNSDIENTFENRENLKSLLNYVEDRRIDSFIYTNAPGYKPYYKAMYDTYFHSKAIDKGLKSTEYRTEDWDSYMFRLINITNSNRDLDALTGLREVWAALDLGNISRLESTTDAMNVAIDVFKIIAANIVPPTVEEVTEEEEREKEEEEDGNCEGEGGDVIDGNTEEKLDGENKSDEATTPEGDAGSDDGSEAEGEDSKDTTPGEYDLNGREKRMLDNAIEKQGKFTNGDVKKSKMGQADRTKVEAISKSGASSQTVGAGSNSSWGSYNKPTIDCIVVEKLTKEIVASGAYDHVLFPSGDAWASITAEKQQEDIDKGVRLGTMLGRKLQVRNQDNTIKYNRLRSGKMDRRAIASLGFGAEAVFEKVLTTSHNAACLHISIDASGSMNGQRWKNSQVAAVAIAKAASMTSNMEVVISYRSIYVGTGAQPLVLIAYDSRKDSFNKITSLFKWLRPGGTTPAGLCFEAILNNITGMGNRDTDKYFINFSDGQPYFSGKDFEYSGPLADAHVKKQVNKMRSAGVKILSYYIDGAKLGDSERASFDLKYGKQSTAYVPVTDILPLAKSLNKTFIER